MRICSLLPSITEVLFALDCGDAVVAVTHECDWPPAARRKTPVTRSRILADGCSSAEIDRQVREQQGSLYELDVDRLAQLRPDIIFTQSLCPVCAVSETLVRDVARTLPGEPQVFSFHPTCLTDVLTMIDRIGALTGAKAPAEELHRSIVHALQSVTERLAASDRRPRAVCLEWTDPPFACGHWTPELVGIAGGVELLGQAGQPSRRASWDELLAADPDVLLLAPCGFTLQRTLQEVPSLQRQRGWRELRAVRQDSVYATDGSAYFNRPGPRLIESLYVLAEIMHRERFRGLAPAGSFQQLVGAGRINA